MSEPICVCGAGECEVHRVGCEVWLKEPTTAGATTCAKCPKTTNSTRNGLCRVCSYWAERARALQREKERAGEDWLWFNRMCDGLRERGVRV